MVQEEGSLCPVCGGLVTDDNCPNCDFRFSSVLVCPHKNLEDKLCGVTKNLCHIDDIGWEICDTLRNLK